VRPRGRAVVVVMALAGAALLQVGYTRAQDADVESSAGPADALAPSYVEATVEKWPPRPRLTAIRMMRKYGPPHEVSPSQLVWRHSAPWKRIVVMRDEIRHDFPRPHLDHLAQTLDYRVSARKVGELAEFDGSLRVDRTAGELTARCNSEEMNRLVLNLAHDIVIGRTRAAEARELLVETERKFSLGEEPKYVAALQFEPSTSAGGDAERPAAPEPGHRASAAGDVRQQTVGLLLAIAESQVDETREAAREAEDVGTRTLARVIQDGGQQTRRATLELAQRLGVVPVEGDDAELLRAEGMASLAKVLQAEGDAYGAAYVNHIVRSEMRALDAIDKRLRIEHDPDLRSHLELVRGIAAAQLNRALWAGRNGES
jgi:hypothetical protein